MTKAMVIGANGQIGSYLCELLKEKGYEVARETSFSLPLSTKYLKQEFRAELARHMPDEIYNMAAMNYAPDSWNLPLTYVQVNGMAPLVMLSVLDEPGHRHIKFFQAGSAEVFEKASVMQSEDTNRLPENPYGLSKMLAMEAVRIYRERGLFACTGIFFNAESPRRKDTFFARKVAKEAVRLKREMEATSEERMRHPVMPIVLGKLEARRDWGWAPEYAEVAWKMLQHSIPIDLVIGTGESRTCREFVLECLKAAKLPDPEVHFDYYVKYEKVKEYTARDTMRACPELARKVLGWQAQYKFSDVARMLVEEESRKSQPREESIAGLTRTIE
jgi:GDPmannose 4,6-dehydratase